MNLHQLIYRCGYINSEDFDPAVSIEAMIYVYMVSGSIWYSESYLYQQVLFACNRINNKHITSVMSIIVPMQFERCIRNMVRQGKLKYKENKKGTIFYKLRK
jgi:hypothetical protein